MTPHPFSQRSSFFLCCLLTLSTGVFANKKGSDIDGKTLQLFKQTFPNAEQVKWIEQADKNTVNFKDDGVLIKIEYDKEGNFISSVRYYTEKNLPINILCKLQKKYGDKKVFGVTEMTTDNTVDYYIKLEDDKSWTTVKSNADGNFQVVEKYKK